MSPTVSIRFDRPPAFGEIVEATITISNTTLDALLVREVELEGQLACLLDGPSSLEGSLQYRRGPDHYLYEPDRPGQTPPVFAGEWALLPSESHTVRTQYRARLFRQTVHVHFRRIPYDRFLEEAYFPVADPHERRRLRFSHVPQSKVQARGLGEPGAEPSMVIFPEEERWRMQSSQSTVDIIMADPFTHSEVAKEVGASDAALVTRWSAEGLWIVDDPAAEETIGIDVEGERIELPRCDLMVFDLLDLAQNGEPISVARPGAKKPPAPVPAARARSFLEKARAQGDRVGVQSVANDVGECDHALLLEPSAGAEE